MATGKKLRNSQVIDGVSFMDAYNIPFEAANRLNNVLRIGGIGDGKSEIVFAVHNSQELFDIDDYNNFPVGSIIIDAIGIGKIFVRTTDGWRGIIPNA